MTADWHWIEDQDARSFSVTVTAPSTRTRIRRVPSRADYSRETIDAILDEALSRTSGSRSTASRT